MALVLLEICSCFEMAGEVSLQGLQFGNSGSNCVFACFTGVCPALPPHGLQVLIF